MILQSLTFDIHFFIVTAKIRSHEKTNIQKFELHKVAKWNSELLQRLYRREIEIYAY